MKKLAIIILVVLMVAVGLFAGCAGNAQNSDSAAGKVVIPGFEMEGISLGPGIIWSQQNVGLWVTAEGKVNVAPDVALLSLGVEVQKVTLADAQKQAAESMDKVMKVLKNKGIADKDIQTQQYNIYPVRRWDEKKNMEELIGYRVTNMVMVKIRQLDNAGSIIDAVTSAGGDDIRINSIAFSIDDPTPHYKVAREKAVKYAMEKAKQIAELSGIKLGKPLYISETPIYWQPIVRNYMKAEDMAGSAPAPTPISGGELELSVSVQMVYDID